MFSAEVDLEEPPLPDIFDPDIEVMPVEPVCAGDDDFPLLLVVESELSGGVRISAIGMSREKDKTLRRLRGGGR